MLEPLVKDSTSIAQVLRKLELKEAGGNHSHISKRIQEYGLDTAHFLGQSSNKGNNRKGGAKKKPWSEILVKRESGPRQKSFQLRRALIEFGREYICEECDQKPVWNKKELRLQVDHKNGNWLDDRPENLQFVCPNCHSQTDGWSGSKGYSETSSTARYYREKRIEAHMGELVDPPRSGRGSR